AATSIAATGPRARPSGSSPPPARDREMPPGRRRDSCILRQPNAGNHPARRRRKEITIGRPYMAGWRHCRAATQHHLVRHELAVVLADRAGERVETGIGDIGTGGPFPSVADHLLQALARGGLRMIDTAIHQIA